MKCKKRRASLSDKTLSGNKIKKILQISIFGSSKPQMGVKEFSNQPFRVAKAYLFI
jgi:hypothetical protein